MIKFFQSLSVESRRWLAASRWSCLFRHWIGVEWRLLLTAAVAGYGAAVVLYTLANGFLDARLAAGGHMGGLDADLGRDRVTLERMLRLGADVRSWREAAAKPLWEDRRLPWLLAPFLSDAEVTKNRWIALLEEPSTSENSPGRVAGEEWRETATAALESLRTNGWYQLRRYLNGGIQFATFWLAFTGVFLVLRQGRWASWEYELMRTASVLLPDKPHRFVADGRPSLFMTVSGSVRKDGVFDSYVNFLEEVQRRLERRYLPTGLVEALLASVRAYQTTETVEEARERLDSGIGHLRAERESRGSMIRYIAWAVPSVGFIGTVLGIGNALGEAHKVLAQGDQKEGAIQDITGQLGTAFDTTLIALLCSLGLMLLWHLTTRYEEKAIHRFHERAKHQVVNRLSGFELGALFRKMLEGQTKELVALFEQHWRDRERRSLEGRLQLLKGDSFEDAGDHASEA